MDPLDAQLLTQLAVFAKSISGWQSVINAPGYDYTLLIPKVQAGIRNASDFLVYYQSGKKFEILNP